MEGRTKFKFSKFIFAVVLISTNIHSYSSSSSSIIINEHVGQGSHAISVFKNGQLQTYSASSPLTSEQIEKFQADVKARQELISKLQSLIRELQNLLRSR